MSTFSTLGTSISTPLWRPSGEGEKIVALIFVNGFSCMLAHFGGMSTRWEATSRSKSGLSVLLEITFKTNRIDCMSYSDKDYDSKINCICVGASLISMRRKQENQGSNVSTQNLYLHPTPRQLASGCRIKMSHFIC